MRNIGAWPLGDVDGEPAFQELTPAYPLMPVVVPPVQIVVGVRNQAAQWRHQARKRTRRSTQCQDHAFAPIGPIELPGRPGVVGDAESHEWVEVFVEIVAYRVQIGQHPAAPGQRNFGVRLVPAIRPGNDDAQSQGAAKRIGIELGRAPGIEGVRPLLVRIAVPARVDPEVIDRELVFFEPARLGDLLAVEPIAAVRIADRRPQEPAIRAGRMVCQDETPKQVMAGKGPPCSARLPSQPA